LHLVDRFAVDDYLGVVALMLLGQSLVFLILFVVQLYVLLLLVLGVVLGYLPHQQV